MGIKSLVGKKMSKTIKFMGQDVVINKLSVAQITEIQDAAKAIEADQSKGFDVLRVVIRASVDEGDQLTDDDFNGFPMDELSKLSTQIMEFSGVAGEKASK